MKARVRVERTRRQDVGRRGQRRVPGRPEVVVRRVAAATAGSVARDVDDDNLVQAVPSRKAVRSAPMRAATSAWVRPCGAGRRSSSTATSSSDRGRPPAAAAVRRRRPGSRPSSASGVVTMSCPPKTRSPRPGNPTVRQWRQFGDQPVGPARPARTASAPTMLVTATEPREPTSQIPVRICTPRQAMVRRRDPPKAALSES